MGKKEQDAKRLRYIRALERFTKSITNYLFKSQNLNKEGFIKKVANAKKLLDRAEVVALYKEEYKALEQLTQNILSYQESDEAIEDIKKDILYRANQIEKSKNFKKYKKPKHSKSALDEWD